MSGKYLTDEEKKTAIDAIEYAHILYAGKIDKLSAKAIAHMRSKTKNEWKDILDESYYILTAKESETAGTDEHFSDYAAAQKLAFDTTIILLRKSGNDTAATEMAELFLMFEEPYRTKQIRAEAAQETRKDERKKCAEIAIKYLCERCPVAFDCHGSCKAQNELHAAIAGKEE